ncbi:MAG: MaoC/PaaZ C-terminal domain-containing protein [Solirubrobacteraceae bacterium]
MATRTLNGPPRLAPLFARSAASMLPGASLLPFVPGRGRGLPDSRIVLPSVRVEPERVAAYAKVCGFTLRRELPIAYPHVLAFPLHIAIMADGSFPFGAVGLVHVENRIVRHVGIPIGQELSIAVSAGELASHRRGRTFTLRTEVSADGELVWEGFSTMLRRGGGSDPGDRASDSGDGASGEGGGSRANRASGDGGGPRANRASGESDPSGAPGTDAGTRDPRCEGGSAQLPAVATWRLPRDLGRRYAAVSGDSNPIHMHPLGARLFGFPSAIAHGMWSKARCLAALESRLPPACEASVRFRKPIVLPARVELSCSPPSEQPIRFALRDAKRDSACLDGSAGPLQGAGDVAPMDVEGSL